MLLERMADILLPKRTAYFETMVALISPEGAKHYFQGRVYGVLNLEPRCNVQPGMPYSSLFQPFGSDKVWAEMSVEEENVISQRGKAFRVVREFLEYF